jgi:hypothetical protein
MSNVPNSPDTSTYQRRFYDSGIYQAQLRRVKPPKPEETQIGVNPRSGNYDPAYAFQNTLFTGTDAVATLVIPSIGADGTVTSQGDAIELGELQTISYSIHRENAPIRVIGHVNPRGFLKGGRTIAGSLIFTVFNEYVFYRINQYKRLLADRNGFFAPLADMLPPFDIVLTFFNELGHGSKMKIFGVTIVDEGQSVSIDDLIIEQTYTFMARGIQPMIKMTNDLPNSTRRADLRARDAQIATNVFGDEVLDNLALLHSWNMIDEVYTINGRGR